MNPEHHFSQGLISSFDSRRASFLAAIDQVMADIRPTITKDPDSYRDSLLNCARAFSDAELTRSELMESDPKLADDVPDEDIYRAHLATVAYLFSLTLHEWVRSTSLTMKSEKNKEH